MHWWQSAVLYQIYPRSFQDSNGDGVGDLAGIMARLPYLAELGVNAIWLSPIYVSPMKDFGYDISDHTAIDPRFGTMDDFDNLLREAHAHGLKVLLDFVPNHTSDEHPWFRDSRSSRTSAKRDWYIWRDPAPGGGPPNNWLSEFGGSVWQFDEDSGQYFHHAFLSCQPDLNWRNPEVREAKHEVMRFWMRRGVDGFRVDVMWHLIKDDQLRDDPDNLDFREGDPPHRRFVQIYSADRPEVYDVVRGMRKVIDEFPERLLIGEIYLPLERLVAYYIGENDGAHMPFNFSLIETPWTAHDIVALIDRYEALLPPGAWPNWVLGNHDRPRLAARLGESQARAAAILLLTLRGTPTLYYGDELGMPQVDVPAGLLHDPVALRVPALGRDGCRTPMQWDATPHAGFSAMTPWLPQSDDAEIRNVDVQLAEPTSLLNLYRRLIAVRRAHPALVTGSYKRIKAEKGLLTFLRQQDDESFLIALNLSGEPHTAILPDDERGMVLVSSMADREGQAVEGRIELAGDEGVVVKLS